MPADLPKPEEGYKLVVKMGNVVLEAGKEYEITADTVLNCSYEKLKFTLTIDGTPKTVEYGDTYTIEKTKPGKKLVSVTVNGTKFTGDSIIIKKDTTVVYEWADDTPAKKEYTVSFAGEGITGLPKSFKVTEGNTFKLPDNLPKQEGHKLIVKMGDKTLEANIDYPISADTVLNCSYEKLKFTLTIDGTPKTVEYGHIYTIEKTKPGKKLVSVKVDGNKFTGDSIIIKKDTTVVYEWADDTPAKKEYTVSFAGEGITGLPESFKTEGNTFKLPDNLPKQEGHKLIVKMGDKTLEANIDYSISADTVLQCSWEKLKFTLTVDGTEQTVEYGDTYTILKKKDGKIMKSVKVDGEVFNEASFVIKKNTIVDYVWAYTVTYEGLVDVPTAVITELQKDVICDAQFTVPYIKGYLITSIMNGSVPVKPGSTIKPTSNITLTYAVEKGTEGIIYSPDTKNADHSVVSSGPDDSGISEIVIPDMTKDGKLVTSIGRRAFQQHEHITTVKLPDSIWKIDTAAFDGCSKLTSINLPDSLEAFNPNALQYCTSLMTITIPKKVWFVGGHTFNGWEATQTIYIEKDTNMSKWPSEWRNGCNAKVYYDGKLLEPTP